MKKESVQRSEEPRPFQPQGPVSVRASEEERVAPGIGMRAVRVSLVGLFILAMLYTFYLAKPFLMPLVIALLLNLLLWQPRLADDYPCGNLLSGSHVTGSLCDYSPSAGRAAVLESGGYFHLANLLGVDLGNSRRSPVGSHPGHIKDIL